MTALITIYVLGALATVVYLAWLESEGEAENCPMTIFNKIFFGGMVVGLWPGFLAVQLVGLGMGALVAFFRRLRASRREQKTN